MQCFEKTFLYINLSKIKPIVFFTAVQKEKQVKEVFTCFLNLQIISINFF